MKRNGLIILLLIMVIGTAVLSSTLLDLKTRKDLVEEDARPAEISEIIITAPECDDCFNPYQVVEEVEKQNVKVIETKEVVYGSDEADQLIEKYGINVVPAVIFMGELEKNESRMVFDQMTKVDKDVFWEPIEPFYIDVVTGEKIGEVEMVILNSKTCTECYDPVIHKEVLEKGYGFKLSNVREVDMRSQEGREIIQKYNIKFLPTILLNGDVEAYRRFSEMWKKFGSVEDDKTYIFREITALPEAAYLDLKTNLVVKPKKDKTE